MIPPRASISRTTCPFPTPPIDGLHGVEARETSGRDIRATCKSKEEAIAAASIPACPPPMITRSNICIPYNVPCGTLLTYTKIIKNGSK
jgi:hypothetical protein